MNRTCRIFVSVFFALSATLAAAQGYPAKPVKILVPFPPGGSSDLVVRTYTPKLSEILGHQVVVDYKGGAGGSIGANDVARAAPDGYTLLQVWDTHAVNHHVYKVPYDYAKSFEPIMLLVQSPGILVAHPAFPASSLKEVIEYARANPGKVTYGSAGAGSSNHLSGLVFSELAGVKMTHVPYKGGGPMITDLLGGHVDIVFGTLPLFEQHVKSGKMKAIATLSKGRIAQLPNVPVAGDTLAGFEAKTWFALLAPAGTPKEIVVRLQRDVAKALNDPKVKEELAGRGFEVVASTPEAAAAFLAEQSDAAGRLIRAAGIKPE
jgi:tripartite-type tricarboxylate transporter receptor subunit TctC